MTELPPARTSGHYAIELVCLGNICRSPTADVVLAHRVAEAALSDRVQVSSSGTGDWHVGQPMDRRAAATLTAAGYDATRHRAQQWSGDDSRSGPDLVLTMDDQNLADLGGRSDRIRKFRDFDPAVPGSDVPDPYYGGDSGFEEVLAMVERTVDALVAALISEQPWGEPTS